MNHGTSLAGTTDPDVISAAPTKDFFITMLVRDIGLIPAIVDLVDNSVDGARRIRPDGQFNGLTVSIRTDPNKFEIWDDCGGIAWEIARDYAFRFGRPQEAPETPNSIGQFGIGMKRALFKLGKRFVVESSTGSEGFTLNVDVEEWRNSPHWTFEHVAHHGGPMNDDPAGTKIDVLDLHSAVADQFGQQHFQSELAQELSRVHQSSTAQGLAISLNGIPVQVDLFKLIQSDELQPAHFSLTLNEDDPPPVNVRLSVGIDISSPPNAGWYVYCNGRLILGPDRSNVTGWGEGGGRMIPQYHNDFARFRGYLFFESADVAKLPWTTTKDGVDVSHPIYRAVRPKMLAMMRPVITFLYALDAERDSPKRDRESLESIVARAEQSRTELANLRVSETFVTPARQAIPKGPATQSIQYRRPIKQIQVAKRKIGVNSAVRVGEETFDYFYERECSDVE
jgi:hypothetical protein